MEYLKAIKDHPRINEISKQLSLFGHYFWRWRSWRWQSAVNFLAQGYKFVVRDHFGEPALVQFFNFTKQHILENFNLVGHINTKLQIGQRGRQVDKIGSFSPNRG